MSPTPHPQMQIRFRQIIKETPSKHFGHFGLNNSTEDGENYSFAEILHRQHPAQPVHRPNFRRQFVVGLAATRSPVSSHFATAESSRGESGAQGAQYYPLLLQLALQNSCYPRIYSSSYAAAIGSSFPPLFSNNFTRPEVSRRHSTSSGKLKSLSKNYRY